MWRPRRHRQLPADEDPIVAVSRFPTMRPRSTQRRRLAQFGFVIMVSLVAVVTAVVLTRPHELAAGPVGSGGGFGNAQPVDVGVPFSFAYLLETEGKEPAVLERVRVLDVTGPIQVLGVMARQHPSGPKPYAFMAAFGFPPPDYPSKSLTEEHIVRPPTAQDGTGKPYGGLQLVVGVKSTGPGIGRIRGVEFTYRVGNRRYRNSSDGKGFLCAPAAEYSFGAPKSDDCPGRLDSYAWDKRFVDFKVAASEKQ